jgi:hypothetical protein
MTSSKCICDSSCLSCEESVDLGLEGAGSEKGIGLAELERVWRRINTVTVEMTTNSAKPRKNIRILKNCIAKPGLEPLHLAKVVNRKKIKKKWVETIRCASGTRGFYFPLRILIHGVERERGEMPRASQKVSASVLERPGKISGNSFRIGF